MSALEWKRRSLTSAIAVSLFSMLFQFGSSQAVAGDIHISFVCTKQQRLPSDLHAIVFGLMSKYRDEGVANWGDRAVAVHFRDPNSEIFFVPLSCGATGNCWWGVISSSPARSYGVINGAILQLTSEHGWPNINVFARIGAGEGTLEVFAFKAGSYRRSSFKTLMGEDADKFSECIDNISCCTAASDKTIGSNSRSASRLAAEHKN